MHPEPYTYSGHNDGMDLDAAYRILGISWNASDKEQIEDILRVIDERARVKAYSDILQMLWEQFEADIIDAAEREL